MGDFYLKNFIVMVFFLGGLHGSNNFDKLLLFNANSYYGIFIKSLNEKVFFKITGNTEIDSVDIEDIQLLQLSSGNKIIDNGIIVGKVKIEDLAVRNVRQELENSFKWKAIGLASVPISIFSGTLFWNLSKKFTSSKNGVPPAYFFGFSSVFSFQFTLANINIIVKGLPRGIDLNAKKLYEDIYTKEIKKQRRTLLLRGILIGALGSGMFAYLSKNVEVY